MGYAFRSSLIIGSMYGLVFLFLFIVGTYLAGWSIYLIAALSLGFIFLQYLISPLIIGWIFRIHWMDYNTLAAQFPQFHQFLTQVSAKHGIKPPRFGIIPDGTPNAFTYGWSKNSARLVITEGILNYLNPEEQVAVIGHEMGHIVHNDFIVMTFVSAIPVLFYTIFRITINSYRYGGKVSRGGSDKSGAYLEAARIAIAILSYMMYILGYLVSLMLSRIREYWADEFSAMETQNPNALSTSLVKIAYGILQDPQLNQSQGGNRSQYVRALGIFDGKSAKQVAYSATSGNGQMDPNLLVKAAAWDLYQPWAKYFEIMSTHPLPAKRIKELNYIAYTKFQQKPGIDLSQAQVEFQKQMGKTAIDNFLGEVFIQIMPKLTFFGWLVLGIGMALGGFNFEASVFTNFWAFLVLGFAFAGIFQLLQNIYKFKGEFKPHTIPDLIGTINVSPVRPVPTITRGRCIGRGVPGLFWSEDVVIQDHQGIMYIDYDLGVGFLNALFGILKVERIKDEDVEIVGWYRRGPSPYIQVHRIIQLRDGKTFRNFKKGFWNLMGILLILIGAGLFYLLYGATFV